MKDLARKERKRLKARLRKNARKVLIARYHVQPAMISGYPIISKYIRHFRPDLKFDGYDLLAQFCGNQAPVEAPKNFAQLDPNTDAFLQSYEWRRVRMIVLKRDGARCKCCGATPADGVRMHVDHIQPRKKRPDLALDTNNLQVLCEVCNHGKGNWDATDWRPRLVINNDSAS